MSHLLQDYDDDFEEDPDDFNDDDDADDDKAAVADAKRFYKTGAAPSYKAPQAYKLLGAEAALPKERMQHQSSQQSVKGLNSSSSSSSPRAFEEKTRVLPAPVVRQNFTPAQRQRLKRVEAVKKVVKLREDKFLVYQSRRGNPYDAYKAQLNAETGGIRQQAVGREEERDMATQTEPTTTCERAVQYKYGDDMEFYQRLEMVQQQRRGEPLELDSRSRWDQHLGQVDHDIQSKMLQVNTTTFTPFVMAAGKVRMSFGLVVRVTA